MTKITNAAQKGQNSDSDIDTDWTDNDIQPTLPVFTRESAVTVAIDQNCSEFDCFSLFFDRDQIRNIKTETNRYAADKISEKKNGKDY